MKKNIIITAISVFLIIILITGAIFVYNRKTIETFGTKFNLMNDAYKKVLFASGQNKTETTKLMQNYKLAFQDFYSSYKTSPIKPYSTDTEWSNSLDKINDVISESENLIKENKFVESHKSLEEIRQIWQQIFTRNKVTMLGFYLTEYHDTMEKAIEYSDLKDYEKLKTTCDTMKAILQNVKDVKVEFSATDFADYTTKLNDVSTNLDNLCTANDDKDDAKIKEYSSKLKPTFLLIYLKYGW